MDPRKNHPSLLKILALTGHDRFTFTPLPNDHDPRVISVIKNKRIDQEIEPSRVITKVS